MTQDEAKAALAFLERVQLSGQEVDAYQRVRHALRSMAFPAPTQVDQADAKPMQQDKGGS